MKKLLAVILSLGLIISPVPVVSTAHAGGGGGYAKIVLGMANGIVGSTILMKCKMGAMQPSLIAYMAGSLVYVAAEILGGKTKKNDNNQSAQSLDHLKATMKDGGDYQKAAVQAQIDNEKSNLKHIQKKRKWMMATKAIYATATALAIIEFILSLPPPPAGPGILKPDIGACTPDPSHIPVEMGIVMAYTAVSGYANGGLMGAGLAVATPFIMEFLGLMSIGTTVTNMSITMLNYSLGRAAFFGAATALVMVIDAELAKEEKRSKKIIADLEKVKAQFQGSDTKLAEGSSVSDDAIQAGGEDSDSDSKKKYELKKLENGVKLAKHCYSNTDKGLEYSEKGCKTPIKLVRPTFESKFDIPALKAGANSSVDMAQAIANGDLAKADVEAANLSSMAAKIDVESNALMKQANDILKAQGKKPIDIDGELQRQVTQLNDALNKKKAGSGNFTLADVKGEGASASVGDASVGKASDVGASDVGKASGTSGADVKNAPTETISIGATDGMSSSATSGEEASLGEEGLDGAGGGKYGSLKGSSFDPYESSPNEGEISKEREASIFKQVSNRYFLNYTKLFKRKQIAPPVQEEAAR